MEKYTLYCNTEQTKKALELGAPIVKVDTRDKRLIYYGNLCYPRTEADYPYAIPTLEQMMGWLEEQGQTIEICRPYKDNPNWVAFVGDVQVVGEYFSTRKEAILRAIDSALIFLGNRK